MYRQAGTDMVENVGREGRAKHQIFAKNDQKTLVLEEKRGIFASKREVGGGGRPNSRDAEFKNGWGGLKIE